jgi:hypothetical protein
VPRTLQIILRDCLDRDFRSGNSLIKIDAICEKADDPRKGQGGEQVEQKALTARSLFHLTEAQRWRQPQKTKRNRVPPIRFIDTVGDHTKDDQKRGRNARPHKTTDELIELSHGQVLFLASGKWHRVARSKGTLARTGNLQRALVIHMDLGTIGRVVVAAVAGLLALAYFYARSMDK